MYINMIKRIAYIPNDVVCPIWYVYLFKIACYLHIKLHYLMILVCIPRKLVYYFHIQKM